MMLYESAEHEVARVLPCPEPLPATKCGCLYRI